MAPTTFRARSVKLIPAGQGYSLNAKSCSPVLSKNHLQKLLKLNVERPLPASHQHHHATAHWLTFKSASSARQPCATSY